MRPSGGSRCQGSVRGAWAAGAGAGAAVRPAGVAGRPGVRGPGRPRRTRGAGAAAGGGRPATARARQRPRSPAHCAPGRAAQPALVVWRGSRGPGPAVSNLPGRNRQLLRPRRAVGAAARTDAGRRRSAAVLPVEAVHGLGGVGKTELAFEFAHRFRSDYDIDLVGPGRAAGHRRGGAGRAGRPAGHAGGSGPGRPDRRVVRRAARPRPLAVDLRQRRRPEALPGWCRRAGVGSVLVTSRWAAWGRHAEPLRLDVLDREESVQFLTPADRARRHRRPGRVGRAGGGSAVGVGGGGGVSGADPGRARRRI